MNSIIETVSVYYGVNPFGRSRQSKVVRCRQVIWYLLRMESSEYFSFLEIANRFAKDTSTIQHGVRTMQGYLSCDTDYKKDIDAILLLLDKKSTNYGCN